MRRILVVDDDGEFRNTLVRTLAVHYNVVGAANAAEARAALAHGVALVLLDIRLVSGQPGDREGLDLLREVRTEHPHVPVVMITAFGELDTAVEAMRLGAADYLQKGRVELRDYRRVIDGLLEQRRLARQVDQLREDLDRLGSSALVGNSRAIAEVRRQTAMVAADGRATVLLTGETGTGKELAARLIHRQGWRREGPFVAIAPSAFAPSLFESELFGHEKGAFTGADRLRAGTVEKSDGGVLFLDEIGDLDVGVQVKLLRLLESWSFTRVGGSDEVNVDIQFIVATNRDLKEQMKLGRFRQDLYFRLNGVEIHLPSLMERPEDVTLLARHFLERQRLVGNTHCNSIAAPALANLRAREWPGNVRELRNCVELGAMRADFDGRTEVKLEDLPGASRSTLAGDRAADALPDSGGDLKERLAEAELAYVEGALKRTGGRKVAAARLLGHTDRFALLRRVKSILEQYPRLVDRYPLVKEGYVGR